MGNGSWETNIYTSSKASRAAAGKKDFEYTTTATKVHESLDPRRINKKPFQKLESRDSEEHPNSWAVILTLDVTGSNSARAADAQKALPKLMESLLEIAPDPQVAIWANDDYTVSGIHALQASDFESDNRVDNHLRNTWLVDNGGGNDGESYDLLLYAAARKTVLDCFERRQKKGYMFLYADEPIFNTVAAGQVAAVFGDQLDEDIPIRQIVKEVKALYNVFVLWPTGGMTHAREQYVNLFGDACVKTLQRPSNICHEIVEIIKEHELQPAVAAPVGAAKKASRL